MKRKIYQDLINWKNSGASKPLMVVGARQIGKTYTIDAFGQSEYQSFLQFNLTDRHDIVQIFESEMNTQDKVDQLEFIVGHPIDFERTLIFFDEVQESEKLIQSLKFFAESPKRYQIICAGSLLGVKLKRFKGSFPVGKVKILHMYPMDFEEYLNACDDSGLAMLIREQFAGSQMMPEPLHDKCIGLFRRYLCVGGMPEAVLNLITANNEVLRFDKGILLDIQESYLADMAKYVRNMLESARIEAIYRSISAQLCNKSHKFQYAKLKKGAKSRDYQLPLSWLLASEMVYACRAVENPAIPLKGYAKADMFKLFLNDPGLLGALIGIRYPDIMLDKPFAYKGILVENYVAGQLASAGLSLHYWRDENTAEIDFLLETDDGVIPLEVKSGNNKNSPSLRKYQERYSPKWVLRLSARNFGQTNRTRSVPLYAAFALSGLT